MPAGEAILRHLAELHRAELLSLDGVFSIPNLTPGGNDESI